MAAFIRVMHKTPDEWYTYPLSALGYISHNKIHRVHISVGGNLYSVAECTSEKECLAVEEAILCNIAASPQGSDLRILDISAIAEHARMTLFHPGRDCGFFRDCRARQDDLQSPEAVGLAEQRDITIIRERLERILALANAMDNCRGCNEDGSCTGCPAFGHHLCAFEEIGEIVTNASGAGGDAE